MSFEEAFSRNQGIALFDTKGVQLDYSQLLKECEIINKELGHNERLLIFILCRQNMATALAILSVLTGQHVAILIPENIDKERLEELVDIYQPNILYHTQDNTFFLEKKTNIVHQLHPQLSILLSTSGSLGVPKQVRLSKKNFFENARSIARYLNILPTDRAITSLPLSYSYGISVLTSHLLVGASVLISDASIMSRTFWEQLTEFQITGLTGVPYTYEIYKKLRLTQRDMPFLRTMTQAGGKLDRELALYFAQYAQQNNTQFYIMYGQTEATARMSYLKPEYVMDYPDSIGCAIPGGRFELQSNQQIIHECNREGELVYYGPNVMMGYAQTLADLAKGPELECLYTGDIAFKNESGLYFITGRKSRFVKLHGQRTSLNFVEQVFKDNGIKCACSGQDDFLALCIESDKDNTVLRTKISQILTEKLHINPQLFQFEIMHTIPHNLNGKPDYGKILEQVKKSG